VSRARNESKRLLARNLPHVTLDARWVDYNREYDNVSINDEERDYYTVGINLRMVPFQGGKNIFAYRRNKLSIERYEVDRLGRENAIVNEVNKRYQQILEAKGVLASAQKGLTEAREAYAYVARGTTLEVNSLNDLLTSELRLTRAEIARIEAEHNLQLAHTMLNFAVGGEETIDSETH
jgi:outer membrane protein TolC